MSGGLGMDLGKRFLSPRINMRTFGINFPFLLLLLIRWNIGLRFPGLIKNNMYFYKSSRPLSLP
jgi:hypothetical protein